MACRRVCPSFVRLLRVVRAPRAARTVHSTAAVHSSDETANPFYEKYKDKLQKVIGLVDCLPLVQRPFSYSNSYAGMTPSLHQAVHLPLPVQTRHCLTPILQLQ